MLVYRADCKLTLVACLRTFVAFDIVIVPRDFKFAGVHGTRNCYGAISYGQIFHVDNNCGQQHHHIIQGRNISNSQINQVSYAMADSSVSWRECILGSLTDMLRSTSYEFPLGAVDTSLSDLREIAQQANLHSVALLSPLGEQLSRIMLLKLRMVGFFLPEPMHNLTTVVIAHST